MATLRTTANSRKRRPTIPAMSKMGMNTATSESAHGNNGEADFAGAFHGRVIRSHARFDVAGDVFDDHDGVVDDEAGADGEGHQR